MAVEIISIGLVVNYRQLQYAFIDYEDTMGGKWLQLLKELAP